MAALMSVMEVQYSPMIHRADEHTLEDRISLKLSSKRKRMMLRSWALVSMISRTKNTTSRALAVLKSPRKSATMMGVLSVRLSFFWYGYDHHHVSEIRAGRVRIIQHSDAAAAHGGVQ